MNDAMPPSALRELGQHLTDPVRLVVMAGIAAVLTVSGPFGTLADLGLGERAVYWTTVVFGTYAVGAAMSCWCDRVLGRIALWPRTALTLLAVSVAVTAVLVLIDAALFGIWPADLRALADLGFIALLVSALPIMAEAMGQARQRQSGIAATATAPPPAVAGRDVSPTDVPRIVARLPLDRRGRLLSLSVADHYVEVRTTAGRGLVLMRLGDAMAETDPVVGFQVHRSHWVAVRAVQSARRTGDTAVLTLTDGTEIPVSRRYVPALREAGLLPLRDRAPAPAEVG